MTPPRLALLFAASALGCAFSHRAAAQTNPAAPERAASAPAREQTDEDRDAARKERARQGRSADQAAPQTANDAPLPPQGAPAPQPRVERSPLRVRREELSLGVDHALSPQWVIGGLLGYSRAKLTRSQASFFTPGAPPDQQDAASVRTRSTSFAGTLTHYPRPDVFVDTSLSFMRTRYEVQRVVNNAALFEGRNAGRQWALSASAGRIWRSGSLALIPHAGIDYMDTRIDALDTSYVLLDPPDGPFSGFRVGEQHMKVWSATLGTQAQWINSTSFGTLTPYARVMWRQRLAIRAEPVVSAADGADPLTTDLASATSRRMGTVAGGLLLQFSGGISAFADLAYTRGNAGLRETRLAAGIKFEL